VRLKGEGPSGSGYIKLAKSLKRATNSGKALPPK